MAPGRQQLTADKASTPLIRVKIPPTPLSPPTIAPSLKKDAEKKDAERSSVKTQIAPPASKSQLNVVLVTAGPSKIKVIREVQALAGLSLTQARAAVEGAPQVIKENLSPTEASLI